MSANEKNKVGKDIMEEKEGMGVSVGGKGGRVVCFWSFIGQRSALWDETWLKVWRSKPYNLNYIFIAFVK